MHGRQPVTQDPLGLEQCGRCQAVELLAREVLPGLLGQVEVQGSAPGTGSTEAGRRIPGDLAEVLTGHGPDRVDRRAVTSRRRGGQAADSLPPGLEGPVGETGLGLVERLVPGGGQPAREIDRVEQGDPDAGLLGRGEQRVTHGVGLRVRHTAGAVVEVVELPDDRVPREDHLGEDRPGERLVGDRVE